MDAMICAMAAIPNAPLSAHGSCSVEWQTTDDDSGLMGELELLHLPKGT